MVKRSNHSNLMIFVGIVLVVVSVVLINLQSSPLFIGEHVIFDEKLCVIQTINNEKVTLFCADGGVKSTTTNYISRINQKIPAVPSQILVYQLTGTGGFVDLECEFRGFVLRDNVNYISTFCISGSGESKVGDVLFWGTYKEYV